MRRKKIGGKVSRAVSVLMCGAMVTTGAVGVSALLPESNYTTTVAEAAEGDVTGMTIATPATKTAFSVGDEFTSDGLVVKADVEGTGNRELQATEYDVSTPDMSTPGLKTITITSKATTTTSVAYNITVTKTLSDAAVTVDAP